MFQLRVELMWKFMSFLQFSVKNHREYPLNFSQNDENFRFSNIHVFLYNSFGDIFFNTSKIRELSGYLQGIVLMTFF